MGAAAAALGVAGLVGGTALSSWGSAQEGAAAHGAAIYNARLATIEAREEADRVRALGRRRAGVNITRIAKSGVRLEGSPLQVMADNAYNVERQAQSVLRAGRAASTLYRMQGRSAREAAGYEVGSSVLTGLGALFGGGTTGGAWGTAAPVPRIPAGVAGGAARIPGVG